VTDCSRDETARAQILRLTLSTQKTPKTQLTVLQQHNLSHTLRRRKNACLLLKPHKTLNPALVDTSSAD
jgi:hypothetical protein